MGEQAMRLDTSLLDGIHAATTAAKSPSTASHKTSGTSSFTSALKAATSSDTTSPATTKTTSEAETTQAVSGHPYAEILTGPRAGMYLNTSHNKRAGETFVMVHRNGVELHVYGTGKDRHVVEMKRHTPVDPSTAKTSSPAPSSGSAATGTPTTGTTTTGTTPSGTVAPGKITTDASTL
jgi:hypothetical protein